MGLVVAIAGAAIAVMLASLIVYCIVCKKLSKKAPPKKGIDPMSPLMMTSTTAPSMPLPPPPPPRVPTIEEDGVLAVLKHKKVTPIDLATEIKYGVQIGSGAFGVVMKAKLRNTDCAIKQLHKGEKRSMDMLAGLLEEFDVMMQLRHPNVVLTLGIAIDNADLTTGIVMELMQASLYDVIYDPSFAPYRDWGSALFSIASDTAKGMAFIHFNGLLHRDLKPGNILIDAQWVAKIADFGNVQSEADLMYESEGQEIAGTPPYMSPEILLKRKYEPPVDVWAFGCVLAHMGTGQIPYQQLALQDRNSMLEVIKSGEVSPLELLFEEANTPKTVIDLAKDCCLPDPKTRPTFQTISEALSAMKSDDDDVRPLVRVKNKKVVSHITVTASAEGGGGGGGDSPNKPGFAHSTYRQKFQRRSSDMRRTSQNSGTDEGSSSSAGTSPKQQGGFADAFMDTFSQTILHTFTEGKEGAQAAAKKAEEEPEYKV